MWFTIGRFSAATHSDILIMNIYRSLNLKVVRSLYTFAIKLQILKYVHIHQIWLPELQKQMSIRLPELNTIKTLICPPWCKCRPDNGTGNTYKGGKYLPKMAASGWRAFPCSRRHLRLDIVLLCGQSFRYAVVQHSRNIAVWNDVVLSLQCAPLVLVARKGSQKYLQHWRGCLMSEQTIFTCICWVRCTLQHPGIWHKRNGGGLRSG